LLELVRCDVFDDQIIPSQGHQPILAFARRDQFIAQAALILMALDDEDGKVTELLALLAKNRKIRIGIPLS
jgi:hypothetical protein